VFLNQLGVWLARVHMKRCDYFGNLAYRLLGVQGSVDLERWFAQRVLF